MATAKGSGRSSSRRCAEVKRAQAVRLVRELRARLGADRGAVLEGFFSIFG